MSVYMFKRLNAAMSVPSASAPARSRTVARTGLVRGQSQQQCEGPRLAGDPEHREGHAGGRHGQGPGEGDPAQARRTEEPRSASGRPARS